MESRARMALHLGGLPAPAVQHPVLARGARYYLDLAYPHVRLAIETTVRSTAPSVGPAAIWCAKPR